MSAGPTKIMSEVTAPSSTPKAPEGGGKEDESGGGGPPVTIILGGGIVGASVLIVVIVIILIVIFVIRSRVRGSRKGGRSRGEEGTQRMSPNPRPTPSQELDNGSQSQPARPLYAEVSRKPPPVPKHTTHSLKSNGGSISTTQPLTAKPRELLAYSDLNIPETFKPYTPPPPITASTANLLGGSRVSAAIYDIPEAMYDDSPDFAMPSGYDMLKDGLFSPEPPHGDLGTLHDSGMLTASLNTDYPPSLTASSSFQSSLKVSGGHPTPNRKPLKTNYNHTYNEHLEPSMLHHSVSPDSSSSLGLPYAPIYDVPRTRKKTDAMMPLKISRQNVVELQELGFGHFGRVVLAATIGISLRDLRLGKNDDPSTSLLVAIKKLRPDSDFELKDNFEKEIEFMSKMKHANVVRLLGVCRTTKESFIMMEYMENGDLHGYLQKQKLVADELGKVEANEVTPMILLYMSVQIASGMRYLASRKFVHRDLAARNCLVGRDFVVKISDFGMSRNLYESLYYRIQGRLILPIRWMAYESFYGKFSVKSDVWSYAVTVWEIFELAKFEPYNNLSDEEFISDAIKGPERKTLQKPDACPKDVYDIMVRCWVHDPVMRADFEEVYSRLFLIYTTLSKRCAQ